MGSVRAVDVLLDCLEEQGVRYVFGNPGTTEQGLIARLADRPNLSYILGLHETVAVAMADGFARATGRTAFVNLHVAPGLANGLSQLYNAHFGHSPLVVTAGQVDTRLLVEDPMLAADTVTLARQFTKWSWELRRGSDVSIAVRRAFRVASQPPQGPVFLSLPIDVLDEMVTRPPTFLQEQPAKSGIPDADAIDAAAKLLSRSRRPVILCGDGVGRGGAVLALVDLAEVLGAPVYAASQSEVNFPNDHSQFVRTLNVNSLQTRGLLENFDVIVAVGTPLFAQFLHLESPLLPDGACVIHLDDGSWEPGKNRPVEVAIVGSLTLGCKALAESVASSLTTDEAESVANRKAELATSKAQARQRLDQRLSDASGPRLTNLRLMAGLRSFANEDCVVVEEAPTSAGALQQVFGFSRSGSLYAARGGALGWGLPGALGVQLAMPDRQVIAVVGDGATNYSVSALWTAAHYRLPVKFVICNNRAYQILKLNLTSYLGPGDHTRSFVGMDLVNPEIDFVSLARGYGVPASRVASAAELETALAQAMNAQGPFLIDALVETD